MARAGLASLDEGVPGQPHSGVILRQPIPSLVDTYDEDEVTLSIAPMPVIISRTRLTLVCVAWMLAGMAMGLISGWLQ